MKEHLFYATLNHFLNSSQVFNELANDIDKFFSDYKITSWLSQNQVNMLGEIFLIGDKKEIIKRLLQYKELQLKRESQKDKWQQEKDGKKAIDKLYEMIEQLDSKYINNIEIIFEDKKLYDYLIELKSNKLKYNEHIYQFIIKKFAYVFIIKYKLGTKEEDKCLKN